MPHCPGFHICVSYLQPNPGGQSDRRSRYRFKADIFGTGWYHSHYSAQYLGGTSGPLVIYGPPHTQFDEDLGPIMLADCKLLPKQLDRQHSINSFRVPYSVLSAYARQ